jgi:hypothetical protein
MTTKAETMLAPHPNGSGSVCRVIVIGKSDDQQRLKVLGVDSLNDNPALLRPINKRYFYAVRVWGGIAMAIMWIGIGLAFYLNWWYFVFGFTVAYFIYNATQKSVADFAASSLADDPNAYNYFKNLGLIWEAEIESVLPDNL